MTLVVVCLSALGVFGSWFGFDFGFGSQGLSVRYRQSIETANIENSQILYRSIQIKPEKSVVLVIDMWDRHPCLPAEYRAESLVGKMNSTLKDLRSLGVQIIFAPHSATDYYKDHKGFLAMSKYPGQLLHDEQALVNSRYSPRFSIPVGCEGQVEDFNKVDRPPLRQHRAIEIQEPDLISENVAQVVHFLRQTGRTSVFIMGIHSNLCVVTREMGISGLNALGFEAYLVRDLTDSLTKNNNGLQLSQLERNAIINAEIERDIAPSVDSKELVNYFSQWKSKTNSFSKKQ